MSESRLTRAEWEACRYSNEPYPPWSIATWGERFAKVVIFVIVSIFGVAVFLGILIVFGMMMETATDRAVDHDRCMKRATNGYEIEKCR